MEASLSRKISHLSFFLLFLVVYIHGYNENLRFSDQPGFAPSMWLQIFERFISDGICRVAVPLFFAISGFLACESIGKTASFSVFASILKKRFYSLFTPYILWSASGICLVIFLQLFPFSKSFFNNYALNNYRPKDWAHILFLAPVPYQLWFIRFLMDYFIIFPLLYFAIRYLREIIILLLFSLWAFPFLYNLPGNFNKALTGISTLFYFIINQTFPGSVPMTKMELEGLFFFSFGIYVSLHGRNWMVKRLRFLPLLIVFLGWIFWIFYRTNLTIHHPFLHYEIHYHQVAFTFFGVLITWYLFDYFNKLKIANSFLASYSSFSFSVFLIHEPLLTILKKSLVRLLGPGDFSLLGAFLLAPLAAFFTSLILSIFLAEKLPHIYGFFTGNRGVKSNPKSA